jgi:lipoprotein-anchoring transpeptidase ErfK/SrfK
MNNQAVWWRPREYWPAGTKVKVAAALDGAELAHGVWGKRTYTTHFTIGSSVISTIDVKTHKMTVTKAGRVVRVLPVTTGMAVDKYRTRNGIKVIMDKRPVESMDAASTGTEKDDPEYYNLKVQWAMRLTWSGEYLHAAPWSVGSQGRANVSHGCTGLSTANAKWLFDFSKIGDVVISKNSPRQLEFGNGYTAWELSWSKWSAGTAPSLHTIHSHHPPHHPLPIHCSIDVRP